MSEQKPLKITNATFTGSGNAGNPNYDFGNGPVDCSIQKPAPREWTIVGWKGIGDCLEPQASQLSQHETVHVIEHSAYLEKCEESEHRYNWAIAQQLRAAKAEEQLSAAQEKVASLEARCSSEFKWYTEDMKIAQARIKSLEAALEEIINCFVSRTYQGGYVEDKTIKEIATKALNKC